MIFLVWFFPSVLQVQQFLARFENIPDMLELDHLTVSGDVTFGKNVSLKVRNLPCPLTRRVSVMFFKIFAAFLCHRQK